MPVPSPGDTVGVPFGGQTVAGVVCGTFVEKTAKASYLGLKIRLTELPPQAQSFGIGARLVGRIRSEGPSALEHIAGDDTQVGLFGAEIRPAPTAPKWFSEYGLDASDELAALMPALTGGKNWREKLRFTAWTNGAWHDTPFAPWSGPLQKIRNTGHMEFVEHALKKNKELLGALKAALTRPKIPQMGI